MKCNPKLREVKEIRKIRVGDHYFGRLFTLFITPDRVSICFEHFSVMTANVTILLVVFTTYYRFLGARGRSPRVDRNIEQSVLTFIAL